MVALPCLLMSYVAKQGFKHTRRLLFLLFVSVTTNIYLAFSVHLRNSLLSACPTRVLKFIV